MTGNHSFLYKYYYLVIHRVSVLTVYKKDYYTVDKTNRVK